MQNFRIFNKSSENMSEVAEKSVDIVIFAPPYNINTPYDDKESSDHKSFEQFKNMLERIISECSRILKDGGVFINESADTIYSNGKIIALSGFIQKLCLDSGLSLSERHINFMHSKNGIELTDFEHNWTADYYTEEEAHSVCHQWLIFKKWKTDFDSKSGKVYYVDYPSDEEGHPCPFSPEHIRLFLDMAKFEPGMTVLEPFMGTARMGEEVLKRGGKYIGYELAEKHFQTVKKKFGVSY
jgi:DNA modification methylase